MLLKSFHNSYEREAGAFIHNGKRTRLSIPFELNELDWKLELSPNVEKLSKHISAFANYAGGGFLAFGIDKHGAAVGIDPSANSKIIEAMGNITRTNVHPAISIDHHVADFNGSKILVIHITESIEKPVHLIKGGLENSYIRSGAQTRKMSKQELAQALLNSVGCNELSSAFLGRS